MTLQILSVGIVIRLSQYRPTLPSYTEHPRTLAVQDILVNAHNFADARCVKSGLMIIEVFETPWMHPVMSNYPLLHEQDTKMQRMMSTVNRKCAQNFVAIYLG